MLALRMRLSATARRAVTVNGVSSSRLYSSIPLHPASISQPQPSTLIRASNPAWNASKSPLRASLPLLSTRFNSTTPASASTPAATTATDAVAPVAEVYPEYISKATLVDPSTYNERALGFIKDLGIDFGWGPSGLAEWLIEHIHVYGGLPWYGTIAATALVIRGLMFYPFLKMSDVTARSKEIQPLVMPLMMKARERGMAGDQQGMQKARMELAELNKVAGINRAWLAFPFLQLPVVYGVFNALRTMATEPVPGMLSGGFGWFHNLSMADPTYSLPLATSGLMALQFYLGGDTGSMSFSPKVKLAMITILPALSFLFFMNWPAAISFYFLVSSVITIVQNRLFRNEKFRELAGLYPMNPPKEAQKILSKIKKAETVKIKTEAPKSITGISWLDKLAPDALSGGGGDTVSGMKQQFAHSSKTKIYDKYEKNRLKKKAEERERRIAEERMRQQEFELQRREAEEAAAGGSRKS